ncbi:MAG: Ppx/GppA family phosphatase [Rhodospirillaceae bacterium]|nr:Ppx/GppA family phosphatase [Rhodospirillaceae bacterium]MBL6941522.1 Ppx/GppA family phosphatase [Rhodospirillales bacterium]
MAGVSPLFDADTDGPGRVAIIDIGSNTLRLVVYDAPLRLPIPMFNEKAQCELGRGLAASGRLNPEGVLLAMNSLSRFINLSHSMGADHLELVATSAVRDAVDGPDFVAEVKRRFNLDVKVLSGPEEAQLAAMGLLSGVPLADGLLGDLGGGSLDLVALEKGSFGEQGTLPLGHLRMAEAMEKGSENAANVIANSLAELPWIKEAKGRTFYAIGGSWRALARIFISQIGHPLHVVDNFTLRRDDALRLSKIVASQRIDSLQRIPGIARRRMETLPAAAMVMDALIRTIEPQSLTFSGFGMREGQLLQILPDKLREQDTLIDACKSFSERVGRFAIRGGEILEWMNPLFEGEAIAERRLRLAACLLSDIGWSEHPDYRAEHAFHRVLRIPFAGLTHPNRVLIAEAVYVRYNGDPDSKLVSPVRSLLDPGQQAWVQVVGLALRLAHTLSGSAPGLLEQTRLKVSDSKLTLVVPEDSELFISETVERRLKTLARSLGLKGAIS